ncbi:ATP-binding protein [Microbacterium paludicola]|uniref:ATP-binding protein n=1 Tax=Microbacterium paludicola TaxID=300019 RepID=UPI0011A4667F|nr:ATP-binding protein [Microbacterium paludicola]
MSRDLHDDHELLAARLLTGGNGVLAASAALGVVTVVVQPRAAAHPEVFQYALLGVYGLFVVAALLAPWSGRRVVAVLNGIVAVGYLALVALAWPAFAITGTPPAGQLLWLLTVIALPVLAAVIAWGQAGGWIMLGALAVTVPLLRLAMDDTSANAIANDVQACATAFLLCALAGTTLARAQRADLAARAARDAGVREAEVAARREVESRAQALVHDEVMATLGFAARATPQMLPVLASQARHAREALRSLSAEPSAPMSVDMLRDTLRTLAHSHGAQFDDRTVASGLPTPDVPAEVAGAVIGAAQQALVNTQRHAPGSTSAVVLRSDRDAVVVEVTDDGPGFDADAVPPGRLGIAVSIVARMQAVGGRALVHTGTGRGVTVELRWGAAPVPRTHGRADAALLQDREMRLSGALLAGGPVLLALFSLVWMDQPAPALTAGAALAAAFILVGHRAGRARAGAVIATAVLCLIAVGAMLFTGGVVPSSAPGPTYAGMWPLVGAAVVLGMLCLRGRPGAAAVILVPVIVIGILSVAPGPFDEVRAAVVRSILIVVAAATLAVSIRVLDRRVARDRALALRASSERAWLAEVTARARDKVLRWDETVGPVLARIAAGHELTDDEKRHCAALEGALRDGYRAGRLDAPAVAAAAARARRRGVDVVLIDDVPDRAIGAADLDGLHRWLVGELDSADGAFIARILPAGRPVIATAASAVGSTDFGG